MSKPKINITLNFGTSGEDTAICNRLLWWDLIEYINKLNNYNFVLELTPEFRDLEKFLIFPNTQKNTRYILYKEKEKSIKKIDFDLFLLIINENYKLDLNYNYEMDFDFYTLNDEKFSDSERAIRTLKLKSEFDSEIFNTSSEYVCFHVRRNNGITVSENDIKSLPMQYQDTYREIVNKFKNMDEIYLFYQDKKYFSIIDNILEINPKQKFYISHDLPEDLLSYWKQKYNGLIYTKSDFLNFIPDKSSLFLDIFDLFFISKSKFLIKTPHSTWSRFAEIYTDKYSNDIIRPKKIITDYKKYLTLNN